MNLLIGLFTIILILTSFFLVLIILMQKAPAGGMGAAMGGGGGAAEAAFGAESNTILMRGTIYAAIVFFVLTLGLYLGHQHLKGLEERRAPVLPAFEEEAGEIPGAEITLPPLPLEEAGESTLHDPEALPESGEVGADEEAAEDEESREEN